MLTANLETVPELVIGQPVDAELLARVDSALVQRQKDFAFQTCKDEVVIEADGTVRATGRFIAMDDALKVHHEIQIFREASSQPRCALRLIFLLLDKPEMAVWHNDGVDGQYSISPDASTEGLSGSIETLPREGLVSAVRRYSRGDRDFRQHLTVDLVVPPLGALIEIPGDAPHRSPTHGKRTWINAFKQSDPASRG